MKRIGDFNPDNMVLGGEADVRYIDYGNLKYFPDENTMKEHLRKLNEAARSVKIIFNLLVDTI